MNKNVIRRRYDVGVFQKYKRKKNNNHSNVFWRNLHCFDINENDVATFVYDKQKK